MRYPNDENHWQLFGSPVYISKGEYLLNKKEIYFLDKIKNKDSSLGHTNNIFSKNSYVLELKEFSNLKKFVDKELKYYVHNIMQINEQKVKPYVTQSWWNFYDKTAYHHEHNHPNSVVSGVYYVQGTQCIVFQKPQSNGFAYDFPTKKWNEVNSAIWRFEPPLGKIILFPSYLWHQVELNQTDKTRISMAFNSYIEGDIGEDIHYTRLKLKRQK
jgi:uncharacterized protein (TIGR02466 family)